MNAAYKWYSYNSNIIQFYSDQSYSSSRKRTLTADSVKETIEQACNIASNMINWQQEIETGKKLNY